MRKLLVWAWVAGVLAAIGLVSACSKGGSYVGTWTCVGEGKDVLDIKKNGAAFLVTDERGQTYSGALDASKVLVVSGVFLVGSLPLPIDLKTGEMICSGCGCARLTKRAQGL